MTKHKQFPKIFFILTLLFMSIPSLAQTSRHTLTHDGIDRAYRLYVPEDFDDDNPAHLIMVLHGGGMTSIDMMDMTSRRFNELVDEHHLNVIVVYPEGVGKGWNDGRIREGQIAYARGVDDVDFLLTLTDTLASEYNIESDELFLTGFSNGAGMSYRVACEHPDRVTAIAPVSNLIASTFMCEPESSVAVLSIVGDKDPILPLVGGDMFYGDIPLGNVLSLDDTLSIWHHTNGCDDYTEPIDLLDADTDDGTIIRVREATDCEQPIISMVIHGGGHTWAGSLDYHPIQDYGRTSKEIEASEVIFDFFLEVGLSIDS